MEYLNKAICRCYFNHCDRLLSFLFKIPYSTWLWITDCRYIWFCLYILKVSGETLERYLNCGDQYCSVLFGVSWCPFSRNIQPIFDALSSMFPQIKHLLVEESSIMPRYVVRKSYMLFFFINILVDLVWIMLFNAIIFHLLCSVLSRNGIHSFPAIMLINQTSRIRYHGPKDLNSLVHFYKKSTG